MKRVVFVGILVAVSVSVGCELPEPLKVGDPCPGITAENIMWFDTDPCKREGNDACHKEAEEAIQLGDGYCPFSVSSCRFENNTPKCVHGCSIGKVLCGEDCVNPNTSVSHCGANMRGMCNNDDPNHFDYKGQNCMDFILKENRAFVCEKTEGCKPTVCNADEYVKRDSDGECIKNDQYNCGGEGIECSADETCVLGECLKNCTKGYIRCYVKNEGMSCIDPQGHEEFCGAKGQCLSDDENDENYRGKVCDAGMHCVDGECVLLKCGTEDNSNEVACGGKCVDITQDPLNCGGCGNNCANHRPAYVSDVMACEDGKCVYTCKTGYENCNDDGTTECIDLTENRKHCGTCGNACAPNEYCQDGTCTPSSCQDENACFQHGSCVTHDPTACGNTCQTCVTTLNAYEATCDDVGICHVVRCQNGFHFVSDTEACEPNTANACGSVDQANVIDCHTLNNVTEVQCINGECMVGNCGPGYHLYDNTCEANSNDDCGYHGIRCSVPNGTSICQDASCVTTACDSGFHQEGNYCTGDNLNNCGGKDCTAESGWLSGICTETTAECQATNCRTGYYLDGTKCKANDQNNCGTKGKKCTIENGTSTCNTSTGECSTPSCYTNYHLSADGTKCKADTESECGASRTNCLSNTGWYSATCNAGVCNATACNTGYYLDGSTCKPNDQNNCGSKGKTCAISHGSSTCNLSAGTCTTPTCDTGYYPDGSVCKPNDQSNCGSKGRKCSVDYGTALCNTSTGVCYVDSCNAGYYLDGSTCKTNDQSNCGVKGKTCTVNNGIATCNISTGTCTTTSCNTGYYLDGSECNQNNQSNCGVKDKICSVDYGTAKCNISTGTCITTGCNSGYYLDGSACNPNDQNNCGTKGKSCSVSHGTSKCNLSSGTCSRILCDPDYHLSSAGTGCTADTNTECGSLRQNCTSMGSRYSGGKCSGGTCVPTGCTSGYEFVNNSACVEFCYVAHKSGNYYCCDSARNKTSCETSSSSGCTQCRSFRMMIDNEFPYTSCLATACDDATRLYCEQTQCSSLNTSCSTSILESYCFVSDQFLAY